MHAATHALLALLILADPAPSDPAPGSVAGTVSIVMDSPAGRARADRSGVVVYLEAPMDPALAEQLQDTPPPAHSLRQVNKTFVPAVSAVLRGTEVHFPNDDMIFHNVFSLSKAKRFDLGLYKSGTTRSITLTRPGIIDVYCNIHPEMAAKILVLENPYFAITGADGSFAIPGVPPGTYPYVAWHARGEPIRGELTVVASATTRLDITSIETPQSNLHTRKDGAPYGRYN